MHRLYFCEDRGVEIKMDFKIILPVVVVLLASINLILASIAIYRKKGYWAIHSAIGWFLVTLAWIVRLAERIVG